MISAFGVVHKSFSSTVKGAQKAKPITQMTAVERAGIKGYHRKAHRMTHRDKRIQDAFNDPKDNLKQVEELRAATKLGHEKRRGRDIYYLAGKGDKGDMGTTQFVPNKGPQRMLPAFITLHPSATASPALATTTIMHETAHATVRKPMSRMVRHSKSETKRWGEEARADMAEPTESMKATSGYYEHAHEPSLMGRIFRPKGDKKARKYRDVQAKIASARKKS